MPFLASPRWLLTIAGTTVQPIAINLVADLTPCSTTACDIEIDLTSGAAPAVKQAVALDIADLSLALSWPVFRGTVQETIATSDPNRTVLRCQGELSKLRDTWDADTDVSGDTDGAAVIAALDASTVTYTAGHIQDAGYVLGAIKPVIGTRRTARSGLVKVLNEMLGMALVEIAGDVQRFAYSLVPDAANIVKTFTRGVDADFWGNERRRGAIDDIRNGVTVNGRQFTCDGSGNPDDDGSCQCVPTATGAASNAALGSGVRTEPEPIQYDAAQDQDLLEWIATVFLEENNRTGDHIVVQTGFDPEVTIGMVIGVKDDIAGVNMVSDAVDKPYVITRVEVKDFDATYQCTGGVAGDAGTVTSGVDRRCNKTVGSGTPIVPGFTPPAITAPIGPSSSPYDQCTGVTVTPSPAGGTYGSAQSVTLTPSESAAVYYTTDGSTPTTGSTLYTAPIDIAMTTTLKYIAVPTGASCTTDPDAQAYVISASDGCTHVPATGWIVDSGSGDVYDLDFVQIGPTGSGHNESALVTVPTGASWLLRCSVFASSNNTAQIGMGFDGLSFQYYATIYATDDGGGLEAGTLSDTDFDATDASGAWQDVELEYDAATGTLTATFSPLGIVLSAPDAAPPTGALYPAVRGFAVTLTGDVQVASLRLCGLGDVLAATWTALVGSWTFPGDTEAINSQTSDSDAYASGHTFDGTERCRWDGTIDFGTSDEVIVSFLLDDTEGAASGVFCGFQVTIGATPAIDVYTFAGFQETIAADASGGADFLFDADPVAGTFAFVLTDPVSSTVIASGSYPLGTWPGDRTLHIEHGTAVACDLDVSAMTVRAG